MRGRIGILKINLLPFGFRSYIVIDNLQGFDLILICSAFTFIKTICFSGTVNSSGIIPFLCSVNSKLNEFLFFSIFTLNESSVDSVKYSRILNDALLIIVHIS
jgi:hypothetical protein